MVPIKIITTALRYHDYLFNSFWWSSKKIRTRLRSVIPCFFITFPQSMLPKSTKSLPAKYVQFPSTYAGPFLRYFSGCRGVIEMIRVSGIACRNTQVECPLKAPLSIIRSGFSHRAMNQRPKLWSNPIPNRLFLIGRVSYIGTNSSKPLIRSLDVHSTVFPCFDLPLAKDEIIRIN